MNERREKRRGMNERRREKGRGMNERRREKGRGMNEKRMGNRNRSGTEEGEGGWCCKQTYLDTWT